MPKLEVQSLDAGYGDQRVIRDLAITLPSARITAIVGANGSGKSTLLKVLSRVLKPSVGEVRMQGRSIHAIPTRELARSLSILPQETHAPEGLTVEELVSYGRYPHRRLLARNADDDRMVEWALEVAKLVAFRDRPLNHLSGGQQQRVWIAMTLAQGAEILMLDEPTSYLDMSHQLEIMELLRELNERASKTVVMVLHDLNLAARYAQHMVVLREGRVYATGTPEQIMTPQTLFAAFGVNAKIISDPVCGAPFCITYQANATTQVHS